MSGMFVRPLVVRALAFTLLATCLGCETYDRPEAHFDPNADPLPQQEDPLVAAQNIPAARGSVISSAGEEEVTALARGGGGGTVDDVRVGRAEFRAAARAGRAVHPDDVQRATAALFGPDSRDIQDSNACEQAFTAFSAFTDELAEAPGARRAQPTPRDRFLEACRAMPEQLQRCWVPDYAMAHKDECEEAREIPGGGGRFFADRTNERQAGVGDARGISGEEPDQSAARAERRARERARREANDR